MLAFMAVNRSSCSENWWMSRQAWRKKDDAHEKLETSFPFKTRWIGLPAGAAWRKLWESALVSASSAWRGVAELHCTGQDPSDGHRISWITNPWMLARAPQGPVTTQIMNYCAGVIIIKGESQHTHTMCLNLYETNMPRKYGSSSTQTSSIRRKEINLKKPDHFDAEWNNSIRSLLQRTQTLE